MRLHFTILICILFLCSCQKKSKNKYIYNIIETEKRIEIPIDSETNIYTRAMHHFIDNGIEYISIENSDNIKDYNTINFYRLDTKSLSHKIKIAKEGDNGVPRFSGHGVCNLDNIFLSGFGTSILYQINRNGKIKKKYNYSVTSKQEYTTDNDFNSLVYKPLIILGNKVYLMQYPVPPNANEKQLLNTSLSLEIDTLTNETIKLPLTYPALWKEGKGMGLNPHCSRIYDGKQFVYAFRMNDNIITTTDHITSKTYPIKSKYISKLNTEGFSKNLSFKDFEKRVDEQAVYGNIIYDKYRNVYYRFAYPECKIDKTYYEYIFCRKEFSIIIIDENFNIIGETLFPAKKYAPGLFFVNKDGLYISENNVENSNTSEDKLIFRCFSIIKNKENTVI